MKNPLKNLVYDGGFTSIFRTVGFIGDSLSSGEHESLNEHGETGYHDFYEYSWGQFMARRCGFTAYNFSKGGLTAKTFLKDYEPKNPVFIKEKACQAYVIALGVNDVTQIMKGNEILGGLQDVDFNNYNNNKDTVIGNYAKIIQKIKELQPKARVFIMTMPKCDWDLKERKETDAKYCELLRQLAKKFDFTYLIDFETYMPPYTEQLKNMYFCGGHLNAMGYKYTADMVMTYIDYIIRENYKDFCQIGFVGTEFHNVKEKW